MQKEIEDIQNILDIHKLKKCWCDDAQCVLVDPKQVAQYLWGCGYRKIEARHEKKALPKEVEGLNFSAMFICPKFIKDDKCIGCNASSPHSFSILKDFQGHDCNGKNKHCPKCVPYTVLLKLLKDNKRNDSTGENTK